MKSLTINANSWHYRLALYGHLDTDYDDGRTDLCRYFWALVRGFFKAPFIVVVGACLGYALVMGPLLAVVVWLGTGFYVPDTVAVAGMGMWFMAGILFGALWVQDQKFDNSPALQLAGAAYRGWKDKTCVMVEVR